jgi:hypothetical protein
LAFAMEVAFSHDENRVANTRSGGNADAHGGKARER